MGDLPGSPGYIHDSNGFGGGHCYREWICSVFERYIDLHSLLAVRHKCTKLACVSRDVVFDESASWYLPPTPNPDSNPSSDDELSEAEMPPDEPEIRTRKESLILFRLSGPNGRLSRYD